MVFRGNFHETTFCATILFVPVVLRKHEDPLATLVTIESAPDMHKMQNSVKGTVTESKNLPVDFIAPVCRQSLLL